MKGSSNRLMSLGLFMLFVIVLSVMLMAGVKAYSSIEGSAEQTREHRAANGAIVNILHSLDTYEAISSRELNGNKVLVLRQNTPAGVFENLIYLWNDGIMTEYVQAGTSNQYNPFSAVKILSSKTFDFEIIGNLVKIKTDQGETNVALHSGMKEAK